MDETEQQTVQISISPRQAQSQEELKKQVSKKSGVPLDEIQKIKIIRRSIDARKKPVLLNLLVEIYKPGDSTPVKEPAFKPKKLIPGKEVLIVGAGPAGLFCALSLLEHGIKPIVIDRGKKISERKKDIARLNRNEALDPESNYCFGEGGAGTFSDGKLYTRSKKKVELRRIIEMLVLFGGNQDLLVDAHPHIGSDKLPQIITKIRQQIIDCGGYVGFDNKLVDLGKDDKGHLWVTTSKGDRFQDIPIVLATGHSAKDLYQLLDRQGIYQEIKGFAMGVRIEHPQEMIDQIQYHSPSGRGKYLPPASYNLSAQINNRGVYSFCMCPGGTIVPSVTGQDEMVVNGMSNSSRNSRWANSGLVVEIRDSDIKKGFGDHALAGLKYQESLEQLAFQNGGNGFQAPAQKIGDFIKGKLSSSLPPSSYHPGLISSPLHFWLPEEIGARLQKGLVNFNKRMYGYGSNAGILVGVESRTSSPVRIPRNLISFEHVSTPNLFPCGEGAGYAGGILSSAIDGHLVAESIAKNYSW